MLLTGGVQSNMLETEPEEGEDWLRVTWIDYEEPDGTNAGLAAT